MQIITVDDKKYLVKGTEKIEEGIDTEKLKKWWNADTALKKENTLYLCQEIQDAEFEDIK